MVVNNNIKKLEETLKEKLGKYYLFIVCLVIIVLVNLVIIKLPLRIDLTRSGVYSLSKISKGVVSTLSEPLTIKCFFTKNLPGEYNIIEQYLRDILQEYSIKGNRYFNYTFYNVSAKEGDINEAAKENQEMAESYGIYPVQIQQLEKDQMKFQKAYMGMVLIHGDVVEKLPSITTTEGLEYKITSAVQKMNNKISALLGLPKPIEVKLFFSSSLKLVGPYMGMSDIDTIPSKIENLVNEVSKKNYDKIKFSKFDPTSDTNYAAMADQYNVIKLNWQSFRDPMRKSMIPAGGGYIGMVVEYNNEAEEVQILKRNPIARIFGGPEYSLTDIDGLKDTINLYIENLLNINENIGYIADHGAPPLASRQPPGMQSPFQQQPEGLTHFNSILSETYSVKEINLSENDIPEGLECLIIAGSKEEFTDYELFEIDQFLMKGKSLAIFYNSFNEINMPQQRSYYNQGPQYIPNNTGLEKLLNHYGLGVKKSYILDESCYEHRSQQGGSQPLYFAPLIKNKYISGDFDFMNNIKGLIMLKVSPVEIIEETVKKYKLKGEKLIASSEKSWEMAERINLSPYYLHPPEDDKEKSSFPIAYILEGSFESYFKGKELPIRENNDDAKNKPRKSARASKIESEKDYIINGKPGKIFLIGSSTVLENNLIDENGKGPNAIFVLNVIDYLNNKEDYAVMRSKSQKFNPLNEVKPAVSIFVKTFNTAGLPVFVVLIGIFMWLKRGVKRRKIQKAFKK